MILSAWRLAYVPEFGTMAVGSKADRCQLGDGSVGGRLGTNSLGDRLPSTDLERLANRFCSRHHKF
jgi:hypothetical protein